MKASKEEIWVNNGRKADDCSGEESEVNSTVEAIPED
jgi:hypothetical protein